MTPMLWLTTLRHLRRHPLQISLSILGIALGVAVAVSIDLATGSARRAFELATEAVTGQATHHVIGGPSGVSDDVFVMLRVALGVRGTAPVVATDVAALEHPGRTFHLLGIDPFAEAPFRPYLGVGPPTSDDGSRRNALSVVSELVAQPGTALLSAPTARELGLRAGDGLAIRVAGARRVLRVVGLFEPRDPLSARALESLLVTDIATAQELTGRSGRLSRVDLVIPDDADGHALLARIRGGLPPGLDLVPAGARAETTGQMTRAFSMNLTALSLLALVVGMFLIYNTMTFSVIQRRTLVGTLRALGVTRREIFGLVMTEALALGVVGTALGLVLGLWLAGGLLQLVTRTINDHYFVVSVREVWVTWPTVAKAVALGVGATLVAALVPAGEATATEPRAVLIRAQLEARARRATPWLAVAGLALLAMGAGLLGVPEAGLALGFTGLFALILGGALLTPMAVIVLVRPAASLVGSVSGLVGRMAARSIGAALSRTAVAIAALMIAVAATIGVGLMIGSFRGAVVRWLEGTLRADVYISPASLIGSRPDTPLDPALLARLATIDGVAAASTSRVVVVSGETGPVNVVALGLARGRRPSFRFASGEEAAIWNAFDAGSIVVSEPFAYRQRIRAGDVVGLRTDRGLHAFRVAGVFYDYGSSAGAVMMSRPTYEGFWEDRAVSGLALEAAAGVDVDALVERARAAATEGGQELIIRSNRALREASLVIFDRTFAITGVLRLLTMAVAFIGVLSALLALELERAREIGVLRAIGLTPRQVWGMVTTQTGLMGALAGLLAVPVGIGLAFVLVFVINRRSFGWTMPVEISPAVVLQGLGLAVAAGLLAGLYPAWKMAGASPAEALREE